MPDVYSGVSACDISWLEPHVLLDTTFELLVYVRLVPPGLIFSSASRRFSFDTVREGLISLPAAHAIDICNSSGPARDLNHMLPSQFLPSRQNTLE